MATIADVLITEYRLHAKHYEDGAKRVVAATRQVGGVLSSVGRGVVGQAAAMTTALLGVTSALSIGWATQQAIEFDTINRSLIAITGSAERAKQVLSFTDKLALPSIFTAQQLASGAKVLEAYGLETERFLPIAEKLGTVFGGTQEALDSYVTSLGYLKGQRFGEAFESLARAGISRDALKIEGLKFDKGGEFLGSVDEAMTAVETLVNKRFGKLSQEMAGGPQAKMASVMDAIGRGARQAGMVILSVLVPAAEKVGNFFSYLVDQKIIEKAVTGITKMFGGVNFGSGLVKALAWVTAALINAPKLVKGIGEAFSYIVKHGAQIAAVLGAVFLGGTMVRGIMSVVTAFKAVRAAIAASTIGAIILQGAVAGAAGIAKAVAGALAGAAAGYAAYKSAEALMPSGDTLSKILSGVPGLDQISKDAAEIEKGFNNSNQGAMQGVLATVTKAMEAKAAKEKANSPEMQTARNTAQLVDLQQKQLDLQRALIGGGQVAQESLSGINVERAGGNINNAKIAKGVQLIMDGISGGFGSQIGVKRGYGYRS